MEGLRLPWGGCGREEGGREGCFREWLREGVEVEGRGGLCVLGGD